MTTFDTLIERNQEFAAHHFPKDLPLMPTLRAIIIGCVDPRVDPAHLFGLGPGEAIVIRNVGGRITPATLETMGMLGRIAQGKEALPRAFIWSFFTTPTAGLLTSKGNPTCWRATLASTKKASRPKRSPIRTRRWRSM